MQFTRSESKAWARKNVKGWYMCPLTPMTKDMTLDEAGIRENIDYYASLGINGLVVGGFYFRNVECQAFRLVPLSRNCG